MLTYSFLSKGKFGFSKIEDAYRLFENKEEGVIKIAVEC